MQLCWYETIANYKSLLSFDRERILYITWNFHRAFTLNWLHINIWRGRKYPRSMSNQEIQKKRFYS